MRIKHLKQLFIISIVLIQYGCKSDVDIVAPYQEKAVIYALLDASSPIQYIKINKVFLGKGDAYVMAQNPDSVNYNPADVSAVLEQYKDKELLGTITLYDTLISGAQEGVFAKSSNQIFITRQVLNPEYTYKLKFENKKTGYKSQAQTQLISPVLIQPGGGKYTFVGADNKYIPKTTIGWTSQANGKIYELTFRFHYKEFSIQGGDTVMRHADWLFSPIYATNTQGGVNMEKQIKGEEFFMFLQSVKDVYFSDNTKRRIGWRGQVIISAASEEYQIYKDLNAPYSSNFQEKPIYTNIENGLGLFSSRVTSYLTERPFSENTLVELVNGKYTGELGFVR